MPAALSLEPNDKDQREAALNELKERRAMIDTNWDYYEGRFKPQLKREVDAEGNVGPDFNVYLKLQTDSVDATRDFFVPRSPTVHLDDERATSPDEELIRDTQRDNGDETFWHNVVMQGATSGHCFVRVVPPEQNKHGDYVRWIPLDSRQIVAWWSADDKDEIIGYERYWGEDRQSWGLTGNYKYRQIIIKINAFNEDSLNFANSPDFWVILDYELKGSEYVLSNDENWMHENAPIISWPHLPPSRGGFYGMHEFGAKELNDQVNWYTSNIKKINAFHGHPRNWATGIGNVNDVKAGPGQLLLIPNSEAKVGSLEMLSDLSSMRDERDRLKFDFFKSNKVVENWRDLISTGKLTNFAVKLLFMPMDNKNTLLQNSYGSFGLVPLTKLTLELNGVTGYEDAHPRIEWPESLPINDAEEVQVIAQELALGIASKRDVVEKRGGDYEALQADLAAEQAAMDVAFGLEPIGISA